MAANLRLVFAHSNIKRQFSKCFLSKYIETHCKHARGRFFSVLASRQVALLLQNSSFSASKLMIESKRLHMGSLKNAETSEYVDPEFVTEEFPLSSVNSKDVGELISRIKCN